MILNPICFAIKHNELLGRIDPTFYRPMDGLPGTDGFHKKYKIMKLKNVTDKIIQPFELIREYNESTNSDSVPFLRAGNILDGQLDLSDLVYVDKRIFDTHKDSKIDKGDILITRTGAKAGATCVVPAQFEDYYVSSHTLRVIPNRNIIDPNYFELFLLSKWGKLQIERLFTGAAQKQLQIKSISDLHIVIPPIKKQIEIVSHLKNIQKQIEKKLAQAEELLAGMDEFVLSALKIQLPKISKKQYYGIRKSNLGSRIDSYSNQSHFRDLFSIINSTGNKVQTLCDISDNIFSGSTPLAGGDAYVEPPNGIRFIRSGEITSDGEVNPTSEVHIREDIHNEELGRSKLKRNDILIAIVGATIGSVGIYESDNEANINQAIAAVRISKRNIIPQYICWYLKSSIGQMILDYFKRPVARANINLEEISQIPLIIPDLSIQKEILKNVLNNKKMANKLISDANEEWGSAKQWFEDQLLKGVE